MQYIETPEQSGVLKIHKGQKQRILESAEHPTNPNLHKLHFKDNYDEYLYTTQFHLLICYYDVWLV
jgi:hypothetical protein